MNAEDVIAKLLKLADEDYRPVQMQFYKTDDGNYAQNDQFLGIRVPVLRKHLVLAKGLSLSELEHLLKNPFHEIRHFAILGLVRRFQAAKTPSQKTEIFEFYISHWQAVNNWDLVDSSASQIVGAYLFEKDRALLFAWASAKSLWQRRIVMVACWFFIKQNDFADALKIAEILLSAKEDLLHKAVGWMLREIGKRDEKILLQFLATHYQQMPRTTLRYAIEKFAKVQQQAYLRGQF